MSPEGHGESINSQFSQVEKETLHQSNDPVHHAFDEILLKKVQILYVFNDPKSFLVSFHITLLCDSGINHEFVKVIYCAISLALITLWDVEIYAIITIFVSKLNQHSFCQYSLCS